MKVILAFLVGWQSAAWCWVFYLEIRHGYAQLIEPNKPILYLEFSLAILVAVSMIGYLGYRAIKEWRKE